MERIILKQEKCRSAIEQLVSNETRSIVMLYITIKMRSWFDDFVKLNLCILRRFIMEFCSASIVWNCPSWLTWPLLPSRWDGTYHIMIFSFFRMYFLCANITFTLETSFPSHNVPYIIFYFKSCYAFKVIQVCVCISERLGMSL